MFALHETIQRRVCRVSFLLLCVVPSVLTLVGVAYCNRPWRARDWQHSLTSTLHLRAEVENVSRPQPGTRVLTNVHFADLQTDAPLGWTEQLRIHETDGHLTLEAAKIELPGDQLGSLISACTTWFATHESSSPITFHASQVSLASNPWKPFELVDLSIHAEPTSENSRKIRLVAKNAAKEALKIDLEQRGRTVRGVINARQASLPAWLLGQLVPGLEGCGDAPFTGAVQVEGSPRDQHGNLVGQIDGVDVRNWVGTASHQLQGEAEIDLEQVRWKNDSLEFAKGRLLVERGAMTYSLLLDMKEKLNCVPGPALQTIQSTSTSDFIPFDRLACQFDLSTRGLVLSSGEAGELLANSEGTLLYAPEPNAAIPLARIVRLFHQPTNQGWLPASQAAHEMAEKLPLPGNESSNASANRR